MSELGFQTPAKIALITGITGQDGAYLANFLLSRGYIVHGIKRRSSSLNTERIDYLYHDRHDADVRLFLHYGDMTDPTNLLRLVSEIRPTEIYNLAAQSHVQVSFKTPEYTANTDALGTLRLLEAIRILRMEDRVRFYQASTSELFGKARETPQRELTPFYPRSPYAVAKLYAYWITVNYREAYKMHASNGILFNHESPIRGETFVTRKITRAVAAIERGIQDKLYLGNLDSKRDWGHARDYVEGMWRILQQEEPDDYVLATGETHTVREFVELAFQQIDWRIVWRGTGVDEIGLCKRTGKVLVALDPAYMRPTEVDLLLGDATKAMTKLGWRHRTTFPELVAEMVAADRMILKEWGLPVAVNQEYPLRNKRVWVAGHRGMVGSALVRRLQSEDCEIVTAPRELVDLRRPDQLEKWMRDVRPQAVFLAAARVGGIHANSTRPAEFIYDNLAIQTTVVEACRKAGVEKVLLMGSSCIYPRLAPQPIPESALLTGPLEPTNEWYAVAKIGGIKLGQAYRRQYGCDYISVMPTNLYGIGDDFDRLQGHVVPALILKTHEAKLAHAPDIDVWGTGAARREFLYVDDAADGMVFLMKNYSDEGIVNIGSGLDVSIADLVGMVCGALGYQGRPRFDTSRPDGTPRKVLDVTRIKAMGWSVKTSLPEGLALTYRWFLENVASETLAWSDARLDVASASVP